jgi:hypothetical protein
MVMSYVFFAVRPEFLSIIWMSFGFKGLIHTQFGTLLTTGYSVCSGVFLYTSYASAVALYNLAKNPDKQQKLFEEIHRYLPDKEQPVTSNILNELKYLKACIKESMRYTRK